MWREKERGAGDKMAQTIMYTMAKDILYNTGDKANIQPNYKETNL